jgi:methyl-accepting chemotaxis protein
MNLTVTSRIAGGFAIIVVLLMVIGISSYTSISGINKNLALVVDEITPQAILSAELKSTLLEINQNLIRYTTTRDKAKLPAIKSKINVLVEQFQSEFAFLNQLSSEYPALANSLRQIQELTDSYLSGLTQIYQQQSIELTKADVIATSKENFEDIADQLDSATYDIIDSISDQALIEELQTIASLVAEATVLAIDSLNDPQISNLDITLKELSSIKLAISSNIERISVYATEQDLSEVISLLNNYNEHLIGENSLLSHYKQQLTAKANVTKLVEKANNIVEQYIEQFSLVIEQVKSTSKETKSDVHDNVQTSIAIIIIVSIFTLLAAIAIGYWVVNSIRKPLNEVNSVLQSVAQGNLTNQIEVKTDDEFAELATWVNSLVNNLREIIEQIVENTNKLSVAAGQTSTITNQTSNNINKQRSQTNQIAQSMGLMASAVEEVSKSARNTSSEVTLAHKETTEGLDIVESNILSITQLAQEIESASDVINQLDEYSTSIGNILDVIRGIAEQTNLLALNAAIEAARAGEQGRGFAVVADEVRTLASRTQESTSEIHQMIERLQNGAHRAVDVMQSSRNKAAMSVDEIQKAGELLKTITEGISAINEMSNHIATAAEEQAAVTEEVHKNINSIAEIADQTAQGAEDTMKSTVEVGQLSEHLKSSVNHFKL